MMIPTTPHYMHPLLNLYASRQGLGIPYTHISSLSSICSRRRDCPFCISLPRVFQSVNTHFAPSSQFDAPFIHKDVSQSSPQFDGPFSRRDLHPEILFYRWSKPIGAYCTLNTDASVARSRSGIGGIIRNSDGQPCVAYGSVVPKIDIDLAELWAVREGLEVAIAHNIRLVNIDTDSTAVVDYIHTPPINIVDDTVRKCVREIQEMLKCFVSWNCKHVNRETNKAADYMSKFAWTQETMLFYPDKFPKELAQIVEDDAEGVLYVREKSVERVMKELNTTPSEKHS